MAIYDPIHDITTESNPPVLEKPPQPATTSTTDKPDVDMEETEVETNEGNDESQDSTGSNTPQTSFGSTANPLTAAEKHKPVILRHKLSDNKLTQTKKKARIHPGLAKSQTIFSSARSRHLKKNDGEPFWRKDIQYELLKSLFEDETKAFTDPFVDSKDEIHMDDRGKDSSNNKLSFAEIYIKTIAHSSKCSRVLKERLLNDMKMSIPTCMICLLVNVGRMNTTINFVPDMKSQLRTYHPIPSLQVNYSEKDSGSKNDKQLQDTPRLKSILKACCDEPGELAGIEDFEKDSETFPKSNIINCIFVLCNAEESVNRRFFKSSEYKFYDLFMTSTLNPHERARLFLWILFNYLETNLKSEEMARNPFGSEIIKLNAGDENDFDIDTEEELSFGRSLLDQRVKFLQEDNNNNHLEGGEEAWSSPGKAKIKLRSREDTNESLPTSSAGATEGTLDTIMDDATDPDYHVVGKAAVPTTQAPMTPTLRRDIDVNKILRLVKTFKHQNRKKRIRRGLLKHEHLTILKELQGPEDLTRLRLKNYKGDFGELSTKMKQLFEGLKDEFGEALMKQKDISEDVQPSFVYENENENENEDLALKTFEI